MKCGTTEAFEKAKDFYLNILGFSIGREWPEGIMIDSGSGLLEIFCNGEGIRQKGALRHIAFTTDDVDAMIRKVMDAGYEVSGGVNAPYIWLRTPENMTSWEFFDSLLSKANVVGTPGSGFGPAGEHYFRLTAFGTKENTVRAIERIRERM